MSLELGYLLLGLFLVLISAVASIVRRLPLTETILYLLAGALLGSFGLNLITVHPLSAAPVVERLAEGAILISLFTTGLKLRVALRDPRWWTALRLAFVAMTITVGLLAALGSVWLGLSLGAAVLLGAILAPTDPVLAAEVQLADATDRDRLRFSLSGEAGLNDGTAFPFVMLGLGLLGLHDLGAGGWKWWLWDVLWAIGGGLAIGTALGTGVGLLILWLRRERREGVGRDEFLAIGLISLSYGAALLVHTYGFLAVFAAGVALRAVERRHSGERVTREVLAMEYAGPREEVAVDSEKAPAHLAGGVLAINQQIERIAEFALVLVIGFMLEPRMVTIPHFVFIAVLCLVIRPMAVYLGLLGATKFDAPQRRLIAWFGIRGIGSLYYLAYAINHGLDRPLAAQLASLTIATIAVSIIVHGITVTPLMSWHQRRSARRSQS